MRLWLWLILDPILAANIQMSYSKEDTEKYRIILATLIDTTLSKPTLDVNTFLDPGSDFDKQEYKYFRDTRLLLSMLFD